MNVKMGDDFLFPFLGDQPERVKNIFQNPIAQHFNIYLSGEIGPPEQYSEWFNIFESAGPNDLITIHINSEGGYMNTAVQMMSAIRRCQAMVIGEVEGYCMSAATLVFLACDLHASSDFSIFMFHTFSTVIGGKASEIHDNINFMKSFGDNMSSKVYEGFLSQSELDQLYAGKDLWMESEEVMLRIKKRETLLKKKTKAKDREKKKTTKNTNNTTDEQDS